MALAVSPSPQSDSPPAFTAASVSLDDASVAELSGALFDRLRSQSIAGSGELADTMTQVEQVARQSLALSVDLLTASEQHGLHYVDGHVSAKVMMRHVNRLSPSEALGRDRCRRMFAKLTVIAAAARNGEIGEEQLLLLARVFANKRVRGAMEGRQEWFLGHAKKLSFKRFQAKVLEWQRLIDEDGPEPRPERTAANRTASIKQDPLDLSWDLRASFSSVDGAVAKRIHDAYCKALFEADWAEARSRLGEQATASDLCRTDSQRRSDATIQIFVDAAANEDGMAPIKIDHNIMWSSSAYEEMARRFAGGAARPFDIDDFRCNTIDGHPLDPTEAFASSVLNNIRRVVVDATGAVIDLGRARRFTGLARLAVQISHTECFWPGCQVPTTQCEVDHSVDHACGGRTCPGNGAPACGRHNRWKQKGYKVWRDKTGQIRVNRPDGTEIR